MNIVQFVGHGALRLAAVGAAARAVTPEEQQGMERLLAEALDAGAFGFSTGLVYAPSVYGNTDELVGLARSMASRGGLYFSHIRGEAATLEQAAEEAITIGERGGVPVQIAHVKASGRENWGKMDRAAAHDRQRPRPRRGRDRRRLSLPGGQHQDGQPAPVVDARRRHLEAARAARPIRRRGSARSATAWWTASAGAPARAAWAGTRS